MNTWRHLLTTCLIALLLLILVSCKAAETRPAEEPTLVVEAPVETEEPVPEATSPPAEPTRAPPTPATIFPTLPLLPTSTPLALPTPATPIVEHRLVEVEWPPVMRLGESDIVRLALIPYQEGYITTIEYPDHQVITQTIQTPSLPGYDLFAVARLDGVGFELSPAGDQAQYLSPEQELFWRWSLTPGNTGQQRLLVSLRFRWIPTSASNKATREVTAYSQGMDVRVISLLGLSQTQALFSGLIGLVFGSGMGLFTLAFVRPTQFRYALKVQSPNPDLKIELPPGIELRDRENSLLRTLFQRYTRLVVKDEFLSGYSGARTFLALPIQPDGRADAYTIAKLGESEAILAEFKNYETHVKHTLPPITARIQQPPVTTPAQSRGLRLAALQYTFIGEPGSTPSSLRQALLENPDPALLYKLFDTFGPNWWMQRSPYIFRLGQEYDRMLPTHLVLEPASGRGQLLDGNTSPAGLKLGVGDLATMHNISNSEMRTDGRSLSLLGKETPGYPALRIRWLSLERPEGATGRVVATRQTLLQQYAAGCDLFDLPDPFAHIPQFLAEAVNGGKSTIHGDLNLENVLLGPGDLVWLIDFAQTRDGHTLYDFVHLEAEIIAHVIAPKITDPAQYLALLRAPGKSPFAELHTLREAIHEVASRCLFNPSQPREYQLALTMACLGALKFANLNQHARHLLYLTAAFQVQDL